MPCWDDQGNAVACMLDATNHNPAAVGGYGIDYDTSRKAALAAVGGGKGALTFDEQLKLATAPRTSYSTTNGTSNSFAHLDPGQLRIMQQQADQAHTDAQNAYDLAVRNGDRVASTANLDRLARSADLVMQLRSAADINAATETGANSRTTATIAGTAAEGAANRGQSAYEAQTGRAFTAGESALTRAQQAGEFAATYSIQKANAERQQLADRIQAAKTYSDLSAAPDLTGYQRFQQAGGGVLGNSLAAGATSLTPQGQLGAARALQAAQTPPAPIPDYVNPYAGFSTTNPYATTPVYSPPAPNVPQAVPIGAAAAVPAAPVAGAAAPPSPPGSTPWVQQQVAAGYHPVYTGVGTLESSGLNTTTGLPRYALGTLGRPVQRLGALHIDPNGGGYPPGFATGGPAQGEFITGDSTDPMDPAAGGAHPEDVQLHDPPGPDNATADITPLVPPGVGDTDGGEDDGSIGALLIAIGRFLSAQEGRGGPPGPPTPLGAMGPRFALGNLPRYADGTGMVTPQDQPYIDQVMQARQGTPFDINPYSYGYDQQSPTTRAIGAAGLQTATGVPGSEVAFEAAKYRPGGLARNSTYARELEEGL